MKELFDEQKEDLFNLAQRGYTDSDVKDYCAENNIPYRLAESFMEDAIRWRCRQETMEMGG